MVQHSFFANAHSAQLFRPEAIKGADGRGLRYRGVAIHAAMNGSDTLKGKVRIRMQARQMESAKLTGTRI